VDPLALIVSRVYPESRRLLQAFDAAVERCRDKGTIPTAAR
jgi:hypothetical protein